jgi:hypothetical protein
MNNVRTIFAHRLNQYFDPITRYFYIDNILITGKYIVEYKIYS